MVKKNIPSTLEHKERSYSLKELATTSKKLTEMEAKIIRARLNGKAIWEMSDEEKRLATDKIMMKGAAISGCALPTTEGFAGVIAEQLLIFFEEFGYSNFTLSEIILSMHMNASGILKYPSGVGIERVEFVGNCFNVVYVAKILEPYRYLRNHLDRKLENQIDGYE